MTDNMNFDVVFIVDGEPKGQPRHRAFAVKNKKTGSWTTRAYNPGTAEEWKSQIAIAAKRFLPSSRIDGPVVLDITLFFPRPKRLMRNKDPEGMVPCDKKPDFDNAAKAVSDCLTAIGMWKDDCQVVRATVEKWYHEKTGKPGAMIRVRSFPDEWMNYASKSEMAMKMVKEG